VRRTPSPAARQSRLIFQSRFRNHKLVTKKVGLQIQTFHILKCVTQDSQNNLNRYKLSISLARLKTDWNWVGSVVNLFNNFLGSIFVVTATLKRIDDSLILTNLDLEGDQPNLTHILNLLFKKMGYSGRFSEPNRILVSKGALLLNEAKEGG